MRKLVGAVFQSLDGVMQAPGGPTEDWTGGFEFGGWLPPFSDDKTDDAVGRLFAQPFDLLLGRKTYEIFAAHWPFVAHNPVASDFDALNHHIAEMFRRITKYVATSTPLDHEWANATAIDGDLVEFVRDLKQQAGGDIGVHASLSVAQALLAAGVVDELRLVIAPIVAGSGRRLLDGLPSIRLESIQSENSPSGSVLAHYRVIP